MKLILVARRFPPDVRSGTETVFENLYRRARARHQVQLVVGYRQSRDLVPPEAVAVDLRGASRGQAWAKMAAATARVERSFRPDAILSNSIEAAGVRVPTACIVHDLNFGQSGRGLGTRVREAFYAIQSKRLRAIVTVSEAARTSLVEAGLPGGKLHVVHNGVDTEAFVPRDRERAGPDDDSIVFAYPSRILPGKGQHLAIDAVARLKRLHKRRATLLIVGASTDAIYLDQLRIQAYEQPIEFHTDVPSIVPWYQAADIVLFPTLMTEGFGYTAVDAMACGKPVIWSDQPAVREATGGIGFPFPQGDVDALREQMMTLMDDAALRARVGAEGRRYVEDHYAWDSVWGRYEKLLESIAS